MSAVSIVIPIYNVERFLSDSIQCALNQTLKDVEIILVDDGSTDNSGSIIDEFAKKDSRIIVVHKDNEGAGPTRTLGISYATGDYLFFPDSDDWYDLNTLEELYTVAKEHNADCVVSGIYGVRYHSDGSYYISDSYLCKDYFFKTKNECRENIMKLFPTSLVFDSPCNKLYRRQVAVDNNITFRPLRRCQDAVWNLDFYNHCSRVVSTSGAYYYYRENTQESTWRKFPKDYIDIQVFYFTHLRELLTSWGVYNGWVKEHYDTSFVIAIDSCAQMYDNPHWGFNRAERRSYVMNCISRPEVIDFIPNASVRADQTETFDLIKSRNVSAIMRRHRMEIIKASLRSNRFLYAIWRGLKRLR